MTRVVALMLCAVFGLGAPAFAQTCDVTVSGKAGDVTVMRDAQGATALWVVERGVMHGEESNQFARPSLELDFALKADGSLGAVQRLEIGITRISDLETGQTPSLRGVEMRAQLDDGRVLAARASDSGDLQRELAFAERLHRPLGDVDHVDLGATARRAGDQVDVLALAQPE